MTVFKTREREFLRLAADVSVSHEELAEAAAAGPDWAQVFELALKHQLDGVLAWRLRDERLDGIVPTRVREECQGQAQHLEGIPRQRYLADLSLVVEAMSALPAGWIVHGGPVPYLCHGGDFWPRDCDNIDLVVCEENHGAAASALADLGAAPAISDQDDLRAELPHGSHLHVHGAKGARWDRAECDPFFLEENSHAEIGGLSVPVATGGRAAALVALGAYRSLSWGGPLPLSKLAHVANLAAGDWSAVSRAAEILAARAARGGPYAWSEATYRRAILSPLRWLLRFVGAAYGGVPAELLRTELEPPLLWPHQGEGLALPCWTWRALPEVEHYVFDWRERHHLAGLVSARLWERYPEADLSWPEPVRKTPAGHVGLRPRP
jgi:hypothetical protein